MFWSVPQTAVSSERHEYPLVRRLAWATAARLVLLSGLFVAVVLVNVRRPTLLSFTVVVGLRAVGLAFFLSGAYAWLLRRRRHLKLLAVLQLITDQALWTVLVYLSGGATSGATSFYGVTCFVGAILIGFRGAAVASLSGAVFFLGLCLALLTGTLAPPADQPREVYDLTGEETLYAVMLNILVLVIVALLAGSLAERLRAAGGRALRAEARAQQAEREAELGRLAAGLAHEIRNPLGAIAGSVRILSSNPDLTGDDRELCEIVGRESQRLEELVSDMLELAKPRRPAFAVVDVSSLGQEVARLSANSGRGVQDVRVICRTDENVLVRADAAMLRQLLWNLVRNAVQVSNPGEEVHVRILATQGRASVAVMDRGPGLSEEAKTRIFDPFFTTRSQGTGIGLAVVKRIVDDHGWRIRVDDTPGGGASFMVELGEVESGQSISQVPDVWTLFPKGTG